MARDRKDSALTAELQDRLRFETLLSDLFARFVSIPPSKVDATIEEAQRRFCEDLGLDRSTLWQPAENDPEAVLVTHLYQARDGSSFVHPGDTAPPPGGGSDPRGPATLPYYRRLDVRTYSPWAYRKLLRGETVVISSLDDLPEEAAPDRAFLRRYDTKSTVLVPLSGGGTWLGFLTFAAIKEERVWPEEVVRRLQLIAQVFTDALARKRDQLRFADLHAELEARLDFETLIADLTSRFVNLPAGELDRQIEDAQRRVCECLGLDLSTLWQWSGGALRFTHIYRPLGGPPLPERFDGDRYFPWSQKELMAGRSTVIPRTEDLPPEAIRDQESWRYFGIKSTLAMPLSTGGSRPFGALAFNATQAEHAWPDAIVKRAELVAQVFANALARQRTDQELRESLEINRATFDQAAVGIAHVGPDGRFLRVNEKLCAITGYPREEIQGMNFQDITHPDDLEADLDFVRRVLSDEIGNYSMEKRYLRSDRSVVWVNLTVSLVRTAEGEPKHFIAVVEDISERKRTEFELQGTRLELWHADRVAQTGAIAASLAHELNQPLTGILSTAQAGLRFMAGGKPDFGEIREILTDIVHDTKRAAAVINGLRAMLRRKETQREPIDPAGAIQEVLDLLHSELIDRQVAHRANLESDYSVIADRAQVQQVVLNLVMNALEAMQNQPSEQRRLDLALKPIDTGEALISVRDSGPGISEDQRRMLFEPFWTTKKLGMGIGLGISRSIVESHGGRLWFENNPDQGATFLFTLPLMTSPEPVGSRTGPSSGR